MKILKLEIETATDIPGFPCSVKICDVEIREPSDFYDSITAVVDSWIICRMMVISWLNDNVGESNVDWQIPKSNSVDDLTIRFRQHTDLMLFKLALS